MIKYSTYFTFMRNPSITLFFGFQFINWRYYVFFIWCSHYLNHPSH